MYIPRHLNLQTYPKIQIDPASVIKPCIASQTARDSFIDRPKHSWMSVFHDFKCEGFLNILRTFEKIQLPNATTNPYRHYTTKAFKYLATAVLHIYNIYISLYAYFYPYSQLSHDNLCDEFAKCLNWSSSVIKAFAWHPNHDRCAVAICNDCIYVYENSTRIRLLRHHHQRKVVDLAWQPNNKEVLVVATQNNIVLWRILDSQDSQNPNQSGLTKLDGANLSSDLRMLRKKDYDASLISNGILKSSIINLDGCLALNSRVRQNFKLLENILPGPIVSIQFDGTGDLLYACSPNSSKIAVINVKTLFNELNVEESKNSSIRYIRKFGQGTTKLLWSPQKKRLATATTSNFVRVFEPFDWSSSSWATQDLVQDIVWSKPTGRVLLIATKEDQCLYALPFFDTPQAGDVGGNKSFMTALDLSERQTDSGSVGGRVHALVWDKNGKRLAVSFKNNPDAVMLFKTEEKPTVEFHHINTIQSDNGSSALLMEFHDKFKNGSLLTICWSDGNCQHLPLTYTNYSNPRNANRISDEDSVVHYQGSPSAPRSLTSFCHVSQPQNKNQTAMFSTSLGHTITEQSNETAHSFEEDED